MDKSAERPARTERMSLRLSTREELLLKQAAAATDQNVTAFVMGSAVSQAEKVLADRRWFLVSDQQWSDFTAMLDAPTRQLPKLKKLLAKAPRADQVDE